MKIAAAVCEYNPFHNGHKYQIETAKEKTGCDAFVSIMSGAFVQRGEPAVFSAKARAHAAVLCGADLVLNLPAVHAVQSAEIFARNAVLTLISLGNIDYLVFGAECNDIEPLYRIASLLANEPYEFKSELKLKMSDGMSYPRARGEAINTILGGDYAALIKFPNNILAIEYLKILIKTKSSLQPILIPRKGAEHDSNIHSSVLASARLIRNKIGAGEDYRAFVPKEAYNIYQNTTAANQTRLNDAVLFNLCTMPLESIASLPDVSEGLENRIKSAALESINLDEAIDKIKTKRYARSRIRRIMLSSLLHIAKIDSQRTPEYIHILDFNEKGRAVLNEAKKTSTLPLAKNMRAVKNIQTARGLWLRELEITAIADKLLEEK